MLGMVGRLRTLTILGLLLFVAWGLGWDGVGRAGVMQSSGEQAETLSGVIDIHAHQAPDVRERAIDTIDLAALAKERGMRGFVIKQHYRVTAGEAYLARKVVPGVEVFGSIVLNRSMGGINLEAVKQFAEVEGGWGRVVFFPTWDAEHYVRGSDQPDLPYVPVSRMGQLLPEVKELLAFIATARTRDSDGPLALATGHSSPEESLMIIREARRVGVEHIVVTHPLLDFIGMTVEQMQEAAELGAFLEITIGSALGDSDEAQARLRQYADAIGTVGPASVIISTDAGSVGRPLHPDALAMGAAGLRRLGFSEQEVGAMMKDNPARLLGLSEAAQLD